MSYNKHNVKSLLNCSQMEHQNNRKTVAHSALFKYSNLSVTSERSLWDGLKLNWSNSVPARPACYLWTVLRSTSEVLCAHFQVGR